MNKISLIWAAPFLLPLPWLLTIAAVCLLSGATWDAAIAFWMTFSLSLINWLVMLASGVDCTLGELFSES